MSDSGPLEPETFEVELWVCMSGMPLYGPFDTLRDAAIMANYFNSAMLPFGNTAAFGVQKILVPQRKKTHESKKRHARLKK